MTEYLDMQGRVLLDGTTQRQIARMSQPARCLRCFKVYDLGTVVITARYADCSVWRTPCCNQAVDDRGETGWTTRRDYERIKLAP
ncbi:hypothetical protein [Mycobacterium sp. 23]|uniref:hypothetical protein n=1 Tax=Mycobacterium sp. 23 TaxID=3400424 RepID=UPI003AABA1BD